MRSHWCAAVALLVGACGGTKSGIGPDPETDAGIAAIDAATVTSDVADGASPKPGTGATHTATCSRLTADGLYLAEYAFPGRSAIELTQVRAMIPIDPSALKWAPGYTQSSTGGMAVRDGAIAVLCGAQSNVTVTFIEPSNW